MSDFKAKMHHRGNSISTGALAPEPAGDYSAAPGPYLYLRGLLLRGEEKGKGVGEMRTRETGEEGKGKGKRRQGKGRGREREERRGP